MDDSINWNSDGEFLLDAGNYFTNGTPYSCTILFQHDSSSMLMKMMLQAKFISWTTPDFKSLADFEQVYNDTTLPKPYVSIQIFLCFPTH